MTNVGVLGAGGWGMTIANLLCGKGLTVRIWEFDAAACEKLAKTRKLPSKLPGVSLDGKILVTNDIGEAVEGAEFVCCAVPSQKLRSALGGLGDIAAKTRPVFVNLAKGIEVGSLKRMSQVLAEELPGSSRSGISTLSGPSHAEEVARGIPTAVTAASDSAEIAEEVQRLFFTPSFRVYTSTDLIGVELAGSLKNIIALAAGMLDGLELGDNTRGALLTRGLAEITRLGIVMGADPMTFSGLSGIGDLITTCLSKHSRNRFVGDQIGRGRKLTTIIRKMTMVAEGVETTRSASALAQKNNVEMPITAEVYRVLFEDKKPEQAIADLMSRDPKAESWARMSP
jgi:glycerol-3-phosphate dehydrogenase (NAD(P)+)